MEREQWDTERRGALSPVESEPRGDQNREGTHTTRPEPRTGPSEPLINDLSKTRRLLSIPYSRVNVWGFWSVGKVQYTFCPNKG